jgi:MoaA/NifB/PqqE/SkfB family radical SAM enzyme
MSSLYTKMKVLHFKEKIDSLPREVEEITPPIHVRMKPTNICNHRCRYCAYRAGDLQLGRDMKATDTIPAKKMFEILEDFEEMGVEAVTFSGGGEPFCYPYLSETVKRLSKTKIRFAALTNGSKLQGEIAELFAHFGTWIRISIDGWDDASYAAYRNVPLGEFKRIMRNMKRFKGLQGTCYLGVSLIVDHKNASHVFSFIKQVKELGVDSAKISPCIISNEAEDNNEFHRPIFQKVKDQIQQAVEELCEDGFELFDAYHELDGKFEKPYSWCPYLQVLPVIGADLKVYTCQDKAYNKREGQIGSIESRRFKDLWFSAKEHFFRIDPRLHCRHHCVANTKNQLILDYLEADKDHLAFV